MKKSSANLSKLNYNLAYRVSQVFLI